MVRTYRPKAIDTSNVQLPRELDALVERLAENNHDRWAQKRIDEGWRYGPRRNDDAMEHPGHLKFGRVLPGSDRYDLVRVDNDIAHLFSCLICLVKFD